MAKGNFDDIIQRTLAEHSISPADSYYSVMDDAYGYNTNVGSEKNTPVFSDKQFDLSLAWKRFQNAQDAYVKLHTLPEAQTELTEATQAYQAALKDPNLPRNREAARWDAQDALVPQDTLVMLDAIDRRQNLGRK